MRSHQLVNPRKVAVPDAKWRKTFSIVAKRFNELAVSCPSPVKLRVVEYAPEFEPARFPLGFDCEQATFSYIRVIPYAFDRFRTLFLSGDQEVVDRWKPVAEEAGTMLEWPPDQIRRWFPPETLAVEEPPFRWLCAIFDLAEKALPGLPLRLKNNTRYFWSGNSSIGLPSGPASQQDWSDHPILEELFPVLKKDVCGASPWYAIVEDVVSGSAHAADWLLDCTVDRTPEEETAARGSKAHLWSQEQECMRAALKVYTGGISDERIQQVVAKARGAGKLEERMRAVHDILPIPSNASLRDLAEFFGVSHEAVRKTEFWQELQRQKAQQTEGYYSRLREKGKQTQPEDFLN